LLPIVSMRLLKLGGGVKEAPFLAFLASLEDGRGDADVEDEEEVAEDEEEEASGEGTQTPPFT
jgi:hypothetical protein